MDNNLKAKKVSKPKQKLEINCFINGDNKAHNNSKSDAFNMDSFAKPLDDIIAISTKNSEKHTDISNKKANDKHTKPNKSVKANSSAEHKLKDVSVNNESNATSSDHQKRQQKNGKKENKSNGINSEILVKPKSGKSANKLDDCSVKSVTKANSSAKQQPIADKMVAILNENNLSKADKAKLNDSLWQLLVKLDKKYFGSTLASNNVMVKWTNKMFICAGITYDHPVEIRISAKLHKLLPHKDLEETLLHEMIHAYHLIMKTCDNHGPKFLSMMNRINKIGNYNITVGHDFEPQMNHYKQLRRIKKLEKTKKLCENSERCV